MSDMYKRLASGYYYQTGSYPQKPIRPILANKPSAAEARIYANRMEVFERDLEVWRQQKDNYDHATSAKVQEFRKDLEEFHGMTNHLKADLLWNKSWERGHSGGYSDVASVYEDLVELVE